MKGWKNVIKEVVEGIKYVSLNVKVMLFYVKGIMKDLTDFNKSLRWFLFSVVGVLYVINRILIDLGVTLENVQGIIVIIIG